MHLQFLDVLYSVLFCCVLIILSLCISVWKFSTDLSLSSLSLSMASLLISQSKTFFISVVVFLISSISFEFFSWFSSLCFHYPSFIIIIIILFILFLAVLGLHCCMRAFSSCRERGLLFIEVLGLLIEVASLVAEHGL